MDSEVPSCIPVKADYLISRFDMRGSRLLDACISLRHSGQLGCSSNVMSVLIHPAQDELVHTQTSVSQRGCSAAAVLRR